MRLSYLFKSNNKNLILIYIGKRLVFLYYKFTMYLQKSN